MHRLFQHERPFFTFFINSCILKTHGYAPSTKMGKIFFSEETHRGILLKLVSPPHASNYPRPTCKLRRIADASNLSSLSLSLSLSTSLSPCWLSTILQAPDRRETNDNGCFLHERPDLSSPSSCRRMPEKKSEKGAWPNWWVFKEAIPPLPPHSHNFPFLEGKLFSLPILNPFHPDCKTVLFSFHANFQVYCSIFKTYA